MNRLHDDPVLQLALANLLRDRRRTLLPGCAAIIALLLLWYLNDTMQDSLTEISRIPSWAASRCMAGTSSAIPAWTMTSAVAGRWPVCSSGWACSAGRRRPRGLCLAGRPPRQHGHDAHCPGSRTRAARDPPGEADRQRPLPRAGTTATSACWGVAQRGNLGVRVGDSVDLISHDRFGAPVGERFEVVGILDNGGFGIDRSIVFLPLSAAQSLLEMPPETDHGPGGARPR